MPSSGSRYVDEEASASGGSNDEEEEVEEEEEDVSGFIDDSEEGNERGPPPASFEATMEIDAKKECKACKGQHKPHTCGKKKGSRSGGPGSAGGGGGGKPEGAVQAAPGEEVNLERELIPIPQKGIGLGNVCDRIDSLSALTRPYFMQSMIGVNGPWDNRATKDWFENKNEQLRYAQLFSRSLLDEGLRDVEGASDDSGDGVGEGNYTSRVLFTFRNTHPQTELDMQLGELSDVCLPQYSTDRQSSLLLNGGPEGGLMGCHSAVLWKMQAESPSIATDSDILTLATCLAQGSHGQDLGGTLWYAPNTNFTDVKPSVSRNKTHATARFFTTQDLNAVQEKATNRVSDDLCPHTLGKIVTERARRGNFEVRGPDGEWTLNLEHGLDNELFVPSCRALNSLEHMGQELTESEDKPQEQIEDRLYNVFVHTDVVHGEDSLGNVRKIRIDCLLVKMKIPGADVGQLLNSLRNTMPGVVLPLTNVLSHMALKLQLHSNGVNLNDVFNPGLKNNISLLTAEAQMLPAVFELARSNDMRNVRWRGMTYDCSSAQSVRVYRRFLAGVLHSRSYHYRVVSMGCNRDTRPSFRQQDRPMAGYGKTLELYNGIHYVRFGKSWLHNQFVDLKNRYSPEEMTPTLLRHMQEEFLEYQKTLVGDETSWYLAVDGAMSWNSGIIGLVNADVVPRYDKPPGRVFVNEPILHMHIQCRMFDIWLRSNLENDHDPYVEFYEGALESRPVADLQWMQKHDAHLSALVLELRKSVNKEVQSSGINIVNRRRLKQEALLRSYGQSLHPVHEQLLNTMQSASIESVGNTMFTTLAYNIRSTVSAGELSDLQNVKYAMMSMMEYKSYGTVAGDRWVADYVPFFEAVDAATGLSPEHAHEGVLVAYWLDLHRERIKLDLSWCNTILFETIEDSLIAAFCWQPKQWGSTLKVADMGHHGVVLKKTGRATREEFTVDWKSPSAGIDSTIDKIGDVNCGFAEYLSLDPDLTRFQAGKTCREHIAGHITPLGMATYLGSGVALNSDGTIDFAATGFREDAFLGGFITEHKKDQASSSASEDKAGTLEKFMGHSGRGSGTQERPWSTTRNQDSRSYMQLYNLPLIVMCGNRPDGCFPTSSLKGGRFGVIPSSVLCGSNGIFRVILGKHSKQAAAPDASAGPLKRKLAREGLHGAEDKSPIKSISREIVLDNMAYFSWRSICRKVFPPVHRNMTLNYCAPGYVLRTDFRSLNKIWRLLTDGLRRPYMEDHDTASRTWFGVYVSSTAFPVWVKSVVAMSHMRAVGLAQPSGDRMVAPMYKSLEDTFVCMHSTPMSFHAQLEALYVFTTQKTLDINAMVLSCYAMHLMGLQNNCELPVIALACQGLALTAEQELRYDGLCEFLMETVYEEGATDSLIHDGYFKPYSMESLCTVLDFNDHGNTDAIKKLWEARNQDSLTSRSTCYMRPLLDTVAYALPESIQAFLDARKNLAGAGKTPPDPFVCGCVGDMVAELFAKQQTEEAEAARPFKQTPPQAHHQPASWWNGAAVPGTRLPGKSRVVTSDKYNIQYEPCYETGHYFRQTMQNLGCAEGIMRHVVMLFGLHEDATREELLLAVLGPYMARKGITSAREFTDKTWKRKIIGGGIPCFEFGCMPHMKSKLDRAMGIETVLGMDVLWFIVAQGLYAREWSSGMDGNYRTVVHQRNMGGQSEALLSLLLHTQIDKAIVPACTRDNFVVLGQASGVLAANLQSSGPAKIFFDARLSTDSFMLDHSRNNQNMLNLRMRSDRELVVVPLQNSAPHHPARTLYYAAMMQAGDSTSSPGNIGLLGLFPPESTYHMQTHWRFCETAYRCLYRLHGEQIAEGTSRFSCAVRLWASSIQPHSTTFIPNLLTCCALTCVSELPCMTYQGGFLFTLRFNHSTGAVLLVPTQPTHAPADRFERELFPPWKALPITGTRTFPTRSLGVVMCAGLESTDEDELVLRLPCERPLKCKSTLFPFMYVPFISWHTAVDLQIVGEQIETPEGPVRVVDVEQRFAAMSSFFIETAGWLQQNPGVPPLLPGNTLFVAKMPGGMFFWVRRVLCAQGGVSQLFFFNDKAHLIHVLRTNSGSPCGHEISHRVHWHEMIAGSLLIDDHLHESNTLFPMYTNAAGESFYRRTTLDGSCFVRAEKMVKYAQMYLKAVLDRNAALVEELAVCGSKSKKSFLMWDDEYVKIFNAKKENEALIVLRTQDLALATQAADSTEMQITHEDCMLGPASQRSLLAVPYSTALKGKRTLGVLKAHCNTGAFMRMGKYYVEFMSDAGRHGSLAIDFMRASECVLREGQTVHLHLDYELYAELTATLPNLRLADPQLHAALQEPGGVCVLNAFYVLGDSKKYPVQEFGTKSCIRVAIETGDGIVVVFVSLFTVTEDREGAKTYKPNVTVRQFPLDDTMSYVSRMEIIDKNKPHAAQARSRKNKICFWK